MKKNIYLAIHIALFLLFPLIIWFLKIPLINSTYGHGFRIFEFAGIIPTIYLLTIYYNKYLKRMHEYKDILLYESLPYILYILYLNYYIDFLSISSDYLCYENAMINFLNSKNIYQNTGYLYPPLLTQLMSLIYISVNKLLILTKITIPEEGIRFLLFYFYQSFNFLLIFASIYLSFKYVRQNFNNQNNIKIFIFLLFLINNPILRNIKFNQINFLILFPILLIMVNCKKEFFIGIIIAISICIKIYLILLVFPIIISKKHKILIGMIVTCISYVVLTIIFGQWHIWNDFVNFFLNIPKNNAFRNNSIYSFIYNLKVFFHFGNIVFYIFLLAIYGIIIIWFSRRELFLLKVQKSNTAVIGLIREFILVDTVGLMLLVTPLAWEHHYIIAIPVFLFGLKFHNILNLKFYIICGILMFVIPTFDIFPFSYHRIIGLLIFLYNLDPQKTFKTKDLSNLFYKEIKMNGI